MLRLFVFSATLALNFVDSDRAGVCRGNGSAAVVLLVDWTGLDSTGEGGVGTWRRAVDEAAFKTLNHRSSHVEYWVVYEDTREHAYGQGRFHLSTRFYYLTPTGSLKCWITGILNACGFLSGLGQECLDDRSKCHDGFTCQNEGSVGNFGDSVSNRDLLEHILSLEKLQVLSYFSGGKVCPPGLAVQPDALPEPLNISQYHRDKVLPFCRAACGGPPNASREAVNVTGEDAVVLGRRTRYVEGAMATYLAADPTAQLVCQANGVWRLAPPASRYEQVKSLPRGAAANRNHVFAAFATVAFGIVCLGISVAVFFKVTRRPEAMQHAKLESSETDRTCGAELN